MKKVTSFPMLKSCQNMLFAMAFLMLSTAITCGPSTKELNEKAETYALAAANQLAECCKTTGAYSIQHSVLNIRNDERHESLEIKMEITWKESKLLGVGQLLKGTLIVDYDGCNPHWEHETEGALGFLNKNCHKECLIRCLGDE